MAEWGHLKAGGKAISNQHKCGDVGGVARSGDGDVMLRSDLVLLIEGSEFGTQSCIYLGCIQYQ